MSIEISSIDVYGSLGDLYSVIIAIFILFIVDITHTISGAFGFCDITSGVSTPVADMVSFKEMPTPPCVMCALLCLNSLNLFIQYLSSGVCSLIKVSESPMMSRLQYVITL